MATTVAQTRVKRDDKKYIYYVKDGSVWQAPRRGSRGQKKAIKKWGTKADMDYSRFVYFVDRRGNVAKAARKGSKGGRRRRSSGGRKRRASTGRRKSTGRRRSAGKRC